MESVQQREIVTVARRFLQEGKPLKAGMLVFERIPLELRPEWSANILEIAYRNLKHVPEIDSVFDFARRFENWPLDQSHRAHHVFDAVRALTISVFPDDKLYDLVLILAENVAGITYTSRQFVAPFDHNRGWRIAEIIGGIAQIRGDTFAEQAWQLHFDERYIQLNAPISCNPGCPVCHPPRWDYLPDIQLQDS